MRLIKKKLDMLPVPERINIVPRRYELIVREHKLDNEKILMCTVYFSENATPTYIFYITKDNYITKELIGATPKWSGAAITHVIPDNNIYKWYYYNKSRPEVYEDDKTRQILAGWTGHESEEDGIRRISYLQSKIRERHREEKEAREQAPWDEQLAHTPPEPEGFKQWIEDKVYKNDQCIYYKANRRKATKGVCTYCENIVDVPEGHANNAKGICPSCGSSITYKCGREDKNVDLGTKEIALYQKVDEGTSGDTIYRSYRTRIIIKINDWFKIKKTIMIHEHERLFINSANMADKYYWDLYKRKKERFVKDEGKMHICGSIWRNRKAYLCDINIPEMKQFDERIKYLPEAILKEPIDLVKLLGSRKRVLICERLAAAKLYKLAAETTNIVSDYVETYKPRMKLNKFLELENDDIDIVREAEMEYCDVNDFKNFKKATGKRLTAEQYKTAHKKLHWGTFTKVCKYTSIGKAIKYMLTVKNNVYKDYLNMCKELKIDLSNTFNLFPKNLQQRHDEVTALINEKRNAAEKKRLDKDYKEINTMEKELNEKYGVENEKYFIRAPHSAYEILLEGQALHHCVGGKGYRDKMKAGQSFILFLRKKSNPDEPWYTIEVSGKNEILQYHGWGNRDRDKKDTESIMKVFRKRLKKLIREDKKKEQLSPVQVRVQTQAAV